MILICLALGLVLGFKINISEKSPKSYLRLFNNDSISPDVLGSLEHVPVLLIVFLELTTGVQVF